MKKSKTTTIVCKVMTGAATRLRCGRFAAATGHSPMWNWPGESGGYPKTCSARALTGRKAGPTWVSDSPRGFPFHRGLGIGSYAPGMMETGFDVALVPVELVAVQV